MENILKFKTNINCNGCKATVTPILDQAEGLCHWNIDLENENKILSVQSNGITSEEIIQMLATVRFKAEKIYS
jgi:copper chaperone CopZ